MRMNQPVYALGQMRIGDTLLVRFSNGITKQYDVIKLGCEWFKMSNDDFYSIYGFNFNPHKCGLYEYCRKLVYG